MSYSAWLPRNKACTTRRHLEPVDYTCRLAISTGGRPNIREAVAQELVQFDFTI